MSVRRYPFPRIDKPLRLFHWQRPQHQAVENRKNRRVRADAQRQRKDGDDGNEGVAFSARKASRRSCMVSSQITVRPGSKNWTNRSVRLQPDRHEVFDAG